MSKSLSDIARQILSESNDSAPDRDAKSSNPNMATLAPKSKLSEPPQALPGEVQDLGPALVKNTDKSGPAKAADFLGKDKSKSSQAAVPAEKPKKQAEIHEDAIQEDETIEEDFEISEELQQFIEKCLKEGMTEDQIEEAIAENFELVEEEQAETTPEQVEEETAPEFDLREHVEALFTGEDLSEDFKMKAQTIMETAIRTKLDEELKLIQEAYAETLEEQVREIQENLAANIDDYLTYVIEQWMGENEIAIEHGLRTELTEDFITGLKSLFAESYIDIPEDKVDILEALGQKVQELEGKLNEEIDRNVQLTKALSESTREDIITQLGEGLTETQKDKLRTLSEGLEFTTGNEFASKVQTLRESYFQNIPETKQVLDTPETSDGLLTEGLDSRMEAYTRILGKKLPN